MSRDVPEAVTDARRLGAVDRSGLVATSVPASFQRLVDLAADLTDAPLGFFTVVDAETSWYKAALGVPAEVVSGDVAGSFCKYVIESREPLFVADAATHPTTAGNPAIEAMGVRAWAGSPVFDPDGEVLGSFCVVDVERHEWTERDRRVIEALAASASDEVARLQVASSERDAIDAVATARSDLEDLSQQQATLLDLIRESLLPSVPPDVADLEVAVRYVAATTTSGWGGDWYDVLDLGDGRAGFVIADVAGHDATAVAVMAQLRPSLHVFARQGGSPAATLRSLHELMIELDVPRFLTIFYGIWDPAAGTFSYHCAGHPPPLIVSDGEVEACMDGRGPLLGTMLDPGGDEHVVDVQAGSTLVAYTDGLYERADEPYDASVDRLLAAAAAGPDDVEEMADHLVATMGPFEADDLALLVLRARRRS